MTTQDRMYFTDALAALKPIATRHKTDRGEQTGFLMADATRALGSLENASNAIAILLAEGLLESKPALIDGDVHTMYRVVAVTPPALH